MQQTVDVEPGGPGTTRVVVAGELDLAAAAAVRKAMERAGDGGPREVEVDLAGVTFLDSTGLAALLGGARDLAARGIAIATRSPRGGEARLVIEMAGVAPLLGLRDEA